MNISKEDLELDGDEVYISLDPDEFGSRYAVIKVEDLKELLDELDS